MKNFVAFYSWQSDLAPKENRNLIGEATKDAISQISKINTNDNIEFTLSLDRDTANVAGSPNITNTIFEKIDKADIFICDVSIVNNIGDTENVRLMPNPNVLIELGYAINSLGWDRIICINNLKYGRLEQLPFDIRAHRISVYNSDDSQAKKKLTGTIKTAITSIINQYETILQKRGKSVKHDKAIFDKISNLFPQNTLFTSIDDAVNGLSTTRYTYNFWSSIERHYEDVLNRFLDKQLDQAYRTFIQDIRRFHLRCATLFFAERNVGIRNAEYRENMTEEERIEYQKNQIYSARKEPIGKEDWPDSDARVEKEQTELSELAIKAKVAYEEFAFLVKEKLY